MPLEINPNPDTIIRVLMTFKGLDNSIDVEEQQLFFYNEFPKWRFYKFIWNFYKKYDIL